MPSQNMTGQLGEVWNNSLLYKATKGNWVCKPILTDFKTWKRALLIFSHVTEKTGEERSWNHREKHTHMYTHPSKKLLVSNHNRGTHLLKGMVIGPNSSENSRSDRIILLSHHAHQSSLPATSVSFLCQALSKCWELKGWMNKRPSSERVGV